MHLVYYLLILPLLVTSCVQQVENSGDPSRNTSAFSERVVPAKWSSDQFPVSIRYGTSFNTKEVSAIEASANSWTDSVQNEIQFFDTSASLIDKRPKLSAYDDGELGVYKETNWPKDLPPSALAVTQIFGQRYNTGSSNEYVKIQHADILVNFENFTFTTDDTWGYDLESVLLHEMGHFLGLQHDDTSSEESVMFPTISRYNNARSPKNKDISTLLSLYGRQVTENKKNLMPTVEIPGEKVFITIELYPNGKEIIKNKRGVVHEVNCNLNHSSSL